MIKALQQELTAVDDRTFKWVLKKPYPKMLIALGKNSTPMAFIMPERIAKTDPFKQIEEYVGSGPMKFAKGEWVPGAKAVFEKFADYVPRQEKASWLAGGKNMLVDRIEWVVMPDPATASAALQNGEVDWWENPDHRSRPAAEEEPQHLGRYRRSARQHRHVPHEPPVSALQRREGAARRADGARPGRIHARAGRRRRHDVEAAARLLHARHAALHRRGRRDPERQARPDGGQEAARGEQLQGRAGHLHRRAGPADHQGAGRRHRGTAQAARHERRFRRNRLGHDADSAAPRNLRPDRAAGACSTRGMRARTA